MRIFICPALMDLLVYLVSFAVFYGAGERGLTLAQNAWLGGSMQIVYLLFSLASGALLTRRNARPILLFSTVASGAVSIACLVLTGFVPLLIALGLFGITAALFFNSFQTFMRGESAPGTLVRTVALYNLAWSIGSAMGTISSGALYRLGMPALCLFTVMVTAIVFIILFRHRARAEDAPSADEHVEQGGEDARPVDANYVWVGWLLIFTICFFQRPIATFMSSIWAKGNIHPFLASVPLFLHMFIQGLYAFYFERLRHRLYRRTPLWIAGFSAVALCLIMAWWPRFACHAVGISLLGFYAGFAYFSAVYYSSNSGRRSFNIGVNECLVGVGSLVGLFVCEAFMKKSGNDNALFYVSAAGILLSTLAQLILGSRRKPQPVAAVNQGSLL
jgi:MFS family permease